MEHIDSAPRGAEASNYAGCCFLNVARAPNGEGRRAATIAASWIYRVRVWGARVGKNSEISRVAGRNSPGCLLGDFEPGFGSVVGDRAESRLKAILPR